MTGIKTYLTVAVAILAALFAYLTGEFTLLQALTAAGLALGLGGNRAVAGAVQTINTVPLRRDATPPSPDQRQWVTYVGAALATLTAVLAFVNGEQDLPVTITAVLGALGINFLGLGIRKATTT